MSSPSPSVVRVVAASFIGTAIEWYDFFLYGYAAALVFNKLFFPTIDPVAGTMAAFATHAVGFFARPLGGIVFGHYGDRLGRKGVLVTTLMLVGVSTCLIGALPTYETAGVLAPILLVSLRFIQGFGVGGEWAGAVLMVVEHGGGRRRGFYASWVQAGAPIGSLLATAVLAVTVSFTGDDFLKWGWRVPFLLGIVLTLVGFFLRSQVLESPLFAQAIREAPPPGLPLVEVLRSHWRTVLLAMGARFAENGCFYFFTVVVLSYGRDILQVPERTLLNGVVLGGFVSLFATVLFGRLSDHVGRRPVYLGGAIALAAFAFPFFWLLGTKTTAGIYAAIAIGMCCHAAMYGPQAAFLAELFGTRVRYTGASIGYQLAAPFSGGLVPLVATALLTETGGAPWPVALYLMGLATVTIVAVSLARETHQRQLTESPG